MDQLHLRLTTALHREKKHVGPFLACKEVGFHFQTRVLQDQITNAVIVSIMGGTKTRTGYIKGRDCLCSLCVRYMESSIGNISRVRLSSKFVQTGLRSIESKVE